MKRTAIFAIISATVPYVAAHGFVSQVAIDGKAYAGNVPNDYQGTFLCRFTMSWMGRRARARFSRRSKWEELFLIASLGRDTSGM